MLNSLLESSGMGQIFVNLFNDMGFMNGNWQNYVMLLISFRSEERRVGKECL